MREQSPEAARLAAIDYGQAIKDLARNNIFPGDLLLKNFGVSGHGRAVFYDYDELCLMTECNFRAIPQPRHHEEEMDDGWFYAAPNDIFPEQFPEVPRPVAAADGGVEDGARRDLRPCAGGANCRRGCALATIRTRRPIRTRCGWLESSIFNGIPMA